MNSKEAKQYINCIVLSYGQCFPMEIDYIRNTLSKHPIVLYKYQKFKKHTFETIRKNALYLPIPKLFDDPFDCLADFALENLYDEKQTNISGYLLKHILKQAIPTFCETSELRALKQDVIKAMKQTGDYKNAYELICKSKLDSGQFNTAKTFLDNCSITVDKFLTDSNFNEYANAAKEPSKVVGIGCLSETKNNKVMWSLYCGKYEGLCIEYGVPNDYQIIRKIFPAIYSKRISNNFTLKVIDSAMANVKRVTMPNEDFLGLPVEDVGALYDLFCLKDSDWSFQKEWRIFGAPNSYFYGLKIQKVYLGFAIKERNKSKMIKLAKDMGFELFLMNEPNRKPTITFKKIV